MTSPATLSRIDELIATAERILSQRRGSCFEAERMVLKALSMAHASRDFARMATCCPILWQARKQRVDMAMKGGKFFIEQPIHEETKIEPGCYLIRPPQVGADARRLRLAALSRDIPVLVLAHEPPTTAGLWPVVAVTPGTTLRTHVDPPRRKRTVDVKWMLAAIDELATSVEEALNGAMLQCERQVEFVLTRLDALAEAESLHKQLESCCHKAAEAAEPTEAAESPE